MAQLKRTAQRNGSVPDDRSPGRPPTTSEAPDEAAELQTRPQPKAARATRASVVDFDFPVSQSEVMTNCALRPPVPPFDEATARQKVQAAEDAWNSRDPERVASAYTQESEWRNRSEFVHGREEIIAFLTRKWEREYEYVLRKSLWAYTDNRIAVRFQYEWHDATGQWWRSYGNENWEFDPNGYMSRREASINDLAIAVGERRLAGPRRPEERDLPIPIR